MSQHTFKYNHTEKIYKYIRFPRDIVGLQFEYQLFPDYPKQQGFNMPIQCTSKYSWALIRQSILQVVKLKGHSTDIFRGFCWA